MRRAVACVDWSAHDALDRGSFSGFIVSQLSFFRTIFSSEPLSGS
jgi:hypothetical protein